MEAPAESVTADALDQRYLMTTSEAKDGYLVHIVQKYRSDKPKGSIIIFTDTCKYGCIVSPNELMPELINSILKELPNTMQDIR